MKQLSSFLVLSVNGTDRISYTFDNINANTGELVSGNEKESFFVVDPTLHEHVEAIRDFIRDNKLTE